MQQEDDAVVADGPELEGDGDIPTTAPPVVTTDRTAFSKEMLAQHLEGLEDIEDLDDVRDALRVIEITGWK